MIVKVKRCTGPDGEAYWQSFRYEGPCNVTVAAVLDTLNYRDDLYDIEGNAAARIRWECSCMQKMCGACAMVINGKPALACCTYVSGAAEDTLVLEPLRKFPVVADLMVDRTVIEECLVRTQAYTDAVSPAEPKEYAHQYAVGKCLKCGLCLEICPNYRKGERFFGAQFANEMYLLHSVSDGGQECFKTAYGAHFAAGCSKSFACTGICPVGIPTLSSMLKMNRA